VDLLDQLESGAPAPTGACAEHV
jgi:hypothetical protein